MAISRNALLGLLAAATAGGCARRVENFMGQSIDGVRFSARARLEGASRDTIVVRIRARNGARQTRRLVWNAGGRELTLRVAPLRGGFEQRVVWDSGKWDSTAAASRSRRDSAGRGLQEVHLGVAVVVMREVSPGDSADVASMTIPVRAILGDSLRSGWYRLAVRGQGNVWGAGELHAADLELRLPRR